MPPQQSQHLGTFDLPGVGPKPIVNMTREELLQVVLFLTDELRELKSPEHTEAYAIGRAELLKRGKW